MKKTIIAAVLLVLGIAAQARASVIFDASANTDNASSITFNNTGSSNTMLVVGVYTDGAALGQVLEVSYAGEYMSQAVATEGNVSSSYLFFLPAPASGSNTLTVTFNAIPSDYHIVVAAYDGVSGIGNTASQAPAANTELHFGSIGTGSWGVYFAGALGSAPVLTAPGDLTSRESTSSGTAIYAAGDTTATSAQTFTATDAVGYTLVGTMLELLEVTTPTDTPSNTDTPTATPSFTATATPSDTPTATFTRTITKTLTSSPTPSDTPTATVTPSATVSPTLTATLTASPTPSNSPSPSATPTLVPPAQEPRGSWPYPASHSITQISLGSLGTWAAISTGCIYQPCIGFAANPAVTPGQNEYYAESFNAVATPSTNGLVLGPGTTSAAIPLAPGEFIWAKAALTAQPSSSLEVKQ